MGIKYDGLAKSPSTGRERVSSGLDDSAVDGWFLPNTPTELFKSGEYNIVPLITIVNLGEINGPGGLLLPQLIPAYVEMLGYQNEAPHRKRWGIKRNYGIANPASLY